jgi:hypothetical protein
VQYLFDTGYYTEDLIQRVNGRQGDTFFVYTKVLSTLSVCTVHGGTAIKAAAQRKAEDAAEEPP